MFCRSLYRGTVSLFLTVYYFGIRKRSKPVRRSYIHFTIFFSLIGGYLYVINEILYFVFYLVVIFAFRLAILQIPACLPPFQIAFELRATTPLQANRFRNQGFLCCSYAFLTLTSKISLLVNLLYYSIFCLLISARFHTRFLLRFVVNGFFLNWR